VWYTNLYQTYETVYVPLSLKKVPVPQPPTLSP